MTGFVSICLTPSSSRRDTGGDPDPRRWGKRETVLYLMLLCHHHSDVYVTMGGDESHFNVALIVRVM